MNLCLLPPGYTKEIEKWEAGNAPIAVTGWRRMHRRKNARPVRKNVNF
jgi:hypothetical protein